MNIHPPNYRFRSVPASGMPQGSILGPMLLLLYENDLTSSVTHSNIAMFADDTKPFKEITSVTDATQLHKDLLNFQTSSSNARSSTQDLQMQINTNNQKTPSYQLYVQIKMCKRRNSDGENRK